MYICTCITVYCLYTYVYEYLIHLSSTVELTTNIFSEIVYLHTYNIFDAKYTYNPTSAVLPILPAEFLVPHD